MDATPAPNNVDTGTNLVTATSGHPEQPAGSGRKPQNRPRKNKPPQHDRGTSGVDRSANPTKATSSNWRKKVPGDNATSAGADLSTGSASVTHNARKPHANLPPNLPSKPSPSTPSGTPGSKLEATAVSGSVQEASTPRNQSSRNNRRGAKFNASLTEPSANVAAGPSRSSGGHGRHRIPVSQKDDLTSTLIHAISTPPYPDCVICFSAIHPSQPTWSCSLSTLNSTIHDRDQLEEAPKGSDPAQCCWATFHLKCIRSWAAKSVKEVSEAWRARGKDRNGEWRCPGCRTGRDVVPNEYW